MEDFIQRFGTCSVPGDASSCQFSIVREGLIVSLLSVGTLTGALSGAKYAHQEIEFLAVLISEIGSLIFSGEDEP